MSNRLPPACESAPAPAVVVWEADGTPGWELNAAAREWAPTLQWSHGEWASLAQGILESARRGDADGHCVMLRLRWRSALLDDGWLAWLLPSEPAAGETELQALREQVLRLREHLHVAEEIGRLGVWERDIRHCRARWDEHMFRFFGFDPAQGVPAMEEALQRIHPDDRERVRADYGGSMQRAGRYDGRYRVLLSHGGIALVHVVWEVKNGADGRPERLIGVMLDDTGSVRAAQRHQAATIQLALAVGLVGISLWRVDLAAQRIQLNDWGYELIGRLPQPDGMSLHEMRECIHPDDREAVARAADLAVAGTGIVDAEARYRRPDGSYRTLLTRRIAQRDEHGRVMALIGVSMDMTEQVEERERARQVARSIELIAEATGVGVWTTDVETRETSWNGQMWRIYGIPEHIRLPQARRVAIELTDPADRERLDDAYRQLVSGRSAPEELEFRIRRPDGEQRWVVGRGRFARQGDREVVFGVFIDVTEQRVTQERLRRAEQRTMLAARAVGLAIWERDLLSGEVWWDAQMYRLRGLSLDDPRPPDELLRAAIHPEDLAEVQRRTAQIIERESEYSFDFRIVRPDGAVRWLAARGSVMRDEQGRALRLLGINWDITEHKRGEDMRREKAAAEEASHAKSEFLSRMSHELRTPLNAVLGFAQLMLQDPMQSLAPKQRERTEHIRDAGRHLLALIDDVLDLTSVEVGTVPLEAQPVVIAPLVGETLQWVAPSAQRAQVMLSQGPLQGVVLGDARRLRQVLANLLSNAVKYNRTGGSVDVSVIDRGDPAWLGVQVRDTGRGLTRTQMQNLFEPFNRLGAERENIEGTGIGLTIVHALVEAMGGRVEVDSRPDVGTEFRVWLPRGQGEPTRTAPAPPAADAAAAQAAGAIDLLYIEDNPINVLLVQELAALRPNVRLHTAPDGRSGIARSHELKPAAVLIDLQLPDIDGFEVLRALRGDPVLQGVVCIALSANAMPDDVARARRSGFDDYWTKPIDFAQFLGGIDALARGELLPAQRRA